MTTKYEQQLQQQWQQYVANEAEHVDIAFSSTQKSQSQRQFKSTMNPMWLSAAAVVMAIGVTWWLSLMPATNDSDHQVADNALVPHEDRQPMLLAANYRLDNLERRIQQAYLQGASELELQQLWQQHQALTN